ncbi:MAG: cytochrome c oxidase accessory protein CcoG [Helicobacteraceae bacterium]|nr:cytochrome c oxidase accessory protein CcoG [Helicobacteraceae bacterium]
MKLPYYKRRYAIMALVSLLLLAVPFIKINGNHIFLLSFDHKKLNLLGVAFDAQELYPLPFLLIFLFLFVFAVTTLGGRVWCGWACPQTIFRVVYRDLIEGKILGLHRRANRQKQIDYSKKINVLKKIAAILIWAVLSIVAAIDFSWYFVPPEDFFVYIQDPSSHKVLIGMISIVAFLIAFVVMRLGETFCGLLCPYVRVQSSMYDRDTIYTIYDEKRGGVIYKDGAKIGKKPLGKDDECIGCEACVAICPTHIDIRKGLQLECINCLECADACSKAMDKMGKPSLINWISARESQGLGKTRYLRFRTIAYGVMLTFIMSALLIIGSSKESMLLNITKSNRPYKVEKVNELFRVSNDYIFLFTNTGDKGNNFYFEVDGLDGVKIATPRKPFWIDSKGSSQEIVVLYTEDNLAKAATDTQLKMNIRAYAVDDENITVTREAIFTFPAESAFK